MSEIDKLTAQVAALREALKHIRDAHWTHWNTADTNLVSSALADTTATAYLTKIKQEARDEALEEAADCALQHGPIEGDYIAFNIRALKGK